MTTRLRITHNTHGLDLPDDWRLAAACRHPDVEPDWWWPEDRSVAGNPTTRRALHICRTHCPVMARCDAAYAAKVTHPCVVGGRRWVPSGGGGSGRVRESLTTRPSIVGCPICQPTTEESHHVH